MTDEKLDKVCKIGQGKDCCRYLGAGADGITCLKKNIRLKGILDGKVAEGKMTAQGDNCEGE
jgi:hypothetical protein